jgi:hypothetical protein
MHMCISTGFPFESKYLNVKGTKIYYIDEGEGLHFIQEDYPHEIGTETTKWYEKKNRILDPKKQLKKLLFLYEYIKKKVI